MSAAATCSGCERKFSTETAVQRHQGSSTVCPKSSKYDASVATEKDTKCPHCLLPCRGEQGVKVHLRRSKTCPGNLKTKTSEGNQTKETEDKTPTIEKPSNNKNKKKEEKKPTEKKAEKKLAEGVQEKKGVRAKEEKSAKDTECEGCGLRFRGQRGVDTHQRSSLICPKSAKYSKEAADVSKEKSASKSNSRLDTKCPHCNTFHRGAKGLEAHLAKSVTCPKSPKYDPNYKKE